jgi:hypothetical protein
MMSLTGYTPLGGITSNGEHDGLHLPRGRSDILTAQENAMTQTFSVTAMTCENCTCDVGEALLELPGVRTAKFPQPVRLATMLASLLAALCAPALAQSAPPQAPSSSPTPSPAPVAKRVTDTRFSLSHLPIVDIVPTFTQPAPFDTAAQTKGYDPFDVGGTIKIPISRALSFSFVRTVGGGLNQAPERYIASTGAVYPPDYRDVALTERLDYQIADFVIEGGLGFRHRLQGTGVSTGRYPYTVSSTEAHYGYLGVTYTSPPLRALGGSRFVLGVTGYEQPVDQHVAVLNRATNLVGYIDENPHQNRYFDTQQQVGIVIPIDPRHGVSVSVRDFWGAGNWYENSPGPWRWDANIVLSATKKFSDAFSLTLRTQDEHYAPQGYPYPTPNIDHVETIDVLADFHVGLNTLVHKK